MQHSVAQLFQLSISPQNQERIQAEIQLKECSQKSGFPSQVLQLISQSDLDFGTRQSAAVWFKNWVKRCWDLAGDQLGQFDNDKQIIEDSLLNVIVQSPPQMQSQLCQALGFIVEEDYPEKYDVLLQQAGSLLMDNSSDQRCVHAALLAIQQIARKYRWCSKEKRFPLNQLVKTAFQPLLQLAQQLVGQQSTEAAVMLKIVLKTYFMAIQYDYPKALQEDQSISQWLTLFITVIDKQIPPPGSNDKEDLRQYPWFKAQKWAYHCISKIYSRYCNVMPSSHTDNKAYRAFSKRLMEKYVPGMVQSVIKQAFAMAPHFNVPDRILFLVLNLLADCIKPATTWNILKDSVDRLMTEFVFPQTCFKASDAELLEDEPVEFITKKLDAMEDYNNPSNAAVQFIVSLCKDRKQIFPSVLQFINHILSNQAGASQQIYGALAILAALNKLLLTKKSPVPADQLSQVLSSFVVPLLESNEVHLKLQAASVLRDFAEVDQNEMLKIVAPGQSEQSGWFLILQKAVHLMDQQQVLPVRVCASLLMGMTIERGDVRDHAAQFVGHIMQSLLQLTNEVDLEVLTAILERLVEIYPEQVTPFSVQLCQQLSQTFIRMMEETMQEREASAGKEDDDQDFLTGMFSERVMAAMGVLKTISTLVLSVQIKQEDAQLHEKQLQLLNSLELACIPCLAFVLQKEVVEMYDDAFELFDSLQYQQKSISQNLWQLFDGVVGVLKLSGSDFSEEIYPVLDNYVSYGSSVVMSHPQLQEQLVDLGRFMITQLDMEDERVHGFRLFESLLMHCRGALDRFVPQILQLSFQQLGNPCGLAYKVHALEGVVNCLWYNPQLTSQLLVQENQVENFLHLWIQMGAKLTRVHDKKLTIMSLLECMNNPVSCQVLCSNVQISSQLMKLLLQCFKTLPEALQIRQELEDEFVNDGGYDQDYSEDDDDDDEDDADFHPQSEYVDFDQDGDVDDEDGSNYLQYLAQKQAADGGAGDNDLDDLDEDWSQQLGEDAFFSTPLDEVNVHEKFKNTMLTLSSSQSGQQQQYYAAMTTALTAEEQQLAQQIINIANGVEQQS
ncbi:hypothetical protein MIR68_007020 [Amoeboaphelidium protococcarum]|nr:hypothetical protein MIR68_007020 [Amoeboaphelidium protococcarum]